jgi:membrane-associated phospholipid phosphatase
VTLGVQLMQQLLNKGTVEAAIPLERTAMTSIRNWTLGFIGTAIMVAVSYVWLDRPIALFVHARLQGYDLFEKVAYIPDALIPIGVIALIAVTLRGLTGRPLSRFMTVLVVSGISLAIAVMVKDQLKFAFGRTWPETWLRNNPSFIRDGVFGFFPFHGGVGYSAFPSGHTAVICTVMTVLWLCYPRFRPLWALAMAAVAIGLVGANFHFLSDVIAGAFIGISAGWIGVVVWETGVHRVRPEAASTEELDSCVLSEHGKLPE